MARIRTIKPEFFRDEDLQDLEAANPGKHVMLVFAGLWGHCDKAGRFKWLPRSLKLDILPFLEFDMAQTLGVLQNAGFVRRYEVDGAAYGAIPTFGKHQRIGGKEAQEPERFPAPVSEEKPKRARKPREAKANDQGSIGEAPEQQSPAQELGREGKGRGEEGKGCGEGKIDAPPSAPPQPEVDSGETENENLLDIPAHLQSPVVKLPKRAQKRTRLEKWDIAEGDEHVAYARDCGMDNATIAVECEKFENHHKAAGSLMADWGAAWKKWCRNWQSYGARRAG